MQGEAEVPDLVAAGDAAEEDIDEEVQKVLHEVAGDAVAEMPQAGTTKVAAQEAEKTEAVRTLPLRVAVPLPTPLRVCRSAFSFVHAAPL